MAAANRLTNSGCSHRSLVRAPAASSCNPASRSQSGRRVRAQSRRIPSHAPDTYPRASRGPRARLRHYRTYRLDRHVQLLTELARLTRQAPGARQTLPRIVRGPRPPELSIRRVACDPVLRRVSLIRSGIISRVCAAHQGSRSWRLAAPPSSVMKSRRLVCRESSILRGDGGSVMTVSPSRPEARRRFGS